MSIRTRIGRLLRRWANRLDPPAKIEPLLPLELIETVALANEIARRSDCYILVWARNTSAPCRLHTWSTWGLNAWQAQILLNCIVCGVTQHLNGLPPSPRRRHNDPDGRDR